MRSTAKCVQEDFIFNLYKLHMRKHVLVFNFQTLKENIQRRMPKIHTKERKMKFSTKQLNNNNHK